MRSVGTTAQGRSLDLVEIGAPGPRGPEAARSRPTALLVCSQHGNEPAGREACLKLLRDLAVSTDPAIIDLLERTTFVFVPTGNPDGRAANQRANSSDVDVNRDHVTLDTPEARAVARVVLDETRVDADVRQSALEPVELARVQRRRVASHLAILDGLVDFTGERGPEAAVTTAAAGERKAAEGAARSAPVYFGGADDEAPAPEDVVDPPPCGYRLTREQVVTLGQRFVLHGIRPDGPFARGRLRRAAPAEHHGADRPVAEPRG